MRGLRRFAIGLLICAGFAAPIAQAQLSREDIVEQFPGLTLEQVLESSVPGFYEIHLGTELVYISQDGRYLLQGQIIDLQTQINITQRRQDALRADLLAAADESRMLVFSPPNPRYTITVFTDVDCPYCRLMQSEIDQVLALGIRVRYLFYPRTGPNTLSWFKARNVWCAVDRHDALNRGMRGETLPDRECGDTPVEEHYLLGRAAGLVGTPMIVAENGQEIGGYVEPQALLNCLQAVSSVGYLAPAQLNACRQSAAAP